MTEEFKQKAENYSNRLYIEPITRHDIRQAYLAGATETTKELQEEITTLKHNKKTVAHISSCIFDVQKKKIEELEKQIAELKAQNEQLKSILSKCYNKCFINNLRTCDDDLLELKGQIKKLIMEE